MEWIFYIIIGVFVGLYQGFAYLVEAIAEAFKRKKEKSTQRHLETKRKQEQFIYNLTKKYPYACSMLLDNTNNSETARRFAILKKQKEFDLIKSELRTRISKKNGFNDTFLRPHSPYGYRVYTGDDDRLTSKKYRVLFRDYFNHYFFANDYYIRSEYDNKTLLTIEERERIHTLIPDLPQNIKDQYNGNFDCLSFESKYFLVSNLAFIIDAYELFKKSATARKRLGILRDTCPRAFNYICMKETGKSLKDYHIGIHITSLDDFSSKEAELIAKQFDCCQKLESEWDRIDYLSSMKEESALLPKGELLERKLLDSAL